jgi:hypothetical protein
LETAVADQLGTFASVIAALSRQVQASKENMTKIMQYAEGKRLFKAKEVELDLSLSEGAAYSALTRLVAEKKLTRLKLHSGGAYGYTVVKQNGSVLTVDVEGTEAKAMKEDLKRLNDAEIKARLDSR